MTPYYKTDFGVIYNCDVLAGLKNLPDNSVDSVVVDPPYGIKFMNQRWDYDIPSTEIWKEVLRILKPGGYAIIACGTRTQHRMAVNIEDAGFTIRDVIAWVYSQGFPKSTNLSDVQQGFGTSLKPAMEFWTLCQKPLKEKTIAKNIKVWGTGGINIDGCRVPLNQLDKSGQRILNRNQRDTNSFKMNSIGADTVNIFNIEGRFPANLIHDGSDEVVQLFPDGKGQQQKRSYKERAQKFQGIYNSGQTYQNLDREVPPAKDELGSAARFYYCAKPSKAEKNAGVENFEYLPKCIKEHVSGSTTLDNNKYIKNFHKTVKPIELMRYFCKLITPSKGVILDPYMGSGTTGIGAVLEFFSFIGIEKHPGYCAIATRRIEHWKPSFLEYQFAQEDF